MQKLLVALGMGDANGDTSSTRVVMMLIVLAVLAPKIVIAIKSATVPQWTEMDMAMLGIAFGTKLVQNVQEKPQTPPVDPAIPATKP